MSDTAGLDWASAEVHDSELSVPLTGDASKGFKQAFRHTVRLLGEHAEWGEVELHKGTVRVGGVQPGGEEKLRHHLESIVTQANATVAEEETQDAETETDAPPGPDGEMTARFRAFAGEDSGDER